MAETGAAEGREAPVGGDDGRVGVYLHLPWCERVCPYCDFAVLAARPLEPEVEARYVERLRIELGAGAGFRDRSLASLYFGGGTPALFAPDSIAGLIEAVQAAFPRNAPGDRLPEITLELNPSTVERARLPDFRAAGVNRLSVGVQSFDDRILKRLGRAHRAAVAWETLEAARAAGFDDLSIDLIFAVPDQTEADLDRDLGRVIDFAPEHVSTYELTFEPETPFGRAVSDGRLTPPDEELAARLIEQVEDRLEGAGYARYEISSYAPARPPGAAQRALLAAASGARPRHGRPLDRGAKRRFGTVPAARIPAPSRPGRRRSIAIRPAPARRSGSRPPPRGEKRSS